MERLIIREFPFESEEYKQAYQLRNKILRHPLGCDLKDEDLSGEGKDWHIGGFSEGKLVGILILTPKENGVVRMRQVAVEESYRGLGVGRRLVEFSEELARSRGITTICLHARETAAIFYEKLGYRCVGAGFLELGIPHQPFEKQIL